MSTVTVSETIKYKNDHWVLEVTESDAGGITYTLSGLEDDTISYEEVMSFKTNELASLSDIVQAALVNSRADRTKILS